MLLHFSKDASAGLATPPGSLSYLFHCPHRSGKNVIIEEVFKNTNELCKYPYAGTLFNDKMKKTKVVKVMKTVLNCTLNNDF